MSSCTNSEGSTSCAPSQSAGQTSQQKIHALTQLLRGEGLRGLPDARAFRVHVIGLYGSGIWPLMGLFARLFPRLFPGKKLVVQGSDLQERPRGKGSPPWLDAVWNYHSAAFLEAQRAPDLQFVLYTGAAGCHHPERMMAHELGVLSVHRGQMLAALSCFYDSSYFVTGSSGKTSTAALTSHLLTASGRDHELVLGGALMPQEDKLEASLPKAGTCASAAALVAEADESDGSHTLYAPECGVITNLCDDHLDFHSSQESLRVSMEAFARRVRRRLVVSCDDPILWERMRALRGQLSCELVSVGTSAQADYRITQMECRPQGCFFSLTVQGRSYATHIPTPLKQQAYNAAMALAAVAAADMPLAHLSAALPSYRGVRRRLEVLHEDVGLTVIDDYAHNAHKLRAAVAGVRESYRHAFLDVWFEPHKESRVMGSAAEFSRAFKGADRVVVAPLYEPVMVGMAPVKKQALPSYHPTAYAQQIKKGSGAPVVVLPSWQEMGKLIPAKEDYGPRGYVMLVCGAGISSRAVHAYFCHGLS